MDKENGQNGPGPSLVVHDENHENPSTIRPKKSAAMGKSTPTADGRTNANVRGRDPPGAYSGGNAALGAHPWHPPGGYGGGGLQQYPPIFPSMHQWGDYHAPLEHNQESSAVNDRTWNVPTFLRHPFAAFMAASHGNHGSPLPWVSSSGGGDGSGHGNQPFLPPVPPAVDRIARNGVKHDSERDGGGREEAATSEEEDESMEQSDQDKTAFIPSMFAPQECVEKIRERNQRFIVARPAVAISDAPRSQSSISSSRSKKTHRRVRASKKKGAHQVSNSCRSSEELRSSVIALSLCSAESLSHALLSLQGHVSPVETSWEPCSGGLRRDYRRQRSPKGPHRLRQARHDDRRCTKGVRHRPSLERGVR